MATRTMIILKEPHRANKPPYEWSYDPDKGTITLVFDPEDGEKYLGMVINLSTSPDRHQISELMWMSPDAEEWLPDQ